MKFAQISVLALALPGPAAHAQWEDDWNPWETETDLGASLVMMPEADEQILARTWAGVSTNRILETGLRSALPAGSKCRRTIPSVQGSVA